MMFPQASIQRASFLVQIESPNTGLICNLYNMDDVEDAYTVSAAVATGPGVSTKGKKSSDAKDVASVSSPQAPAVPSLPALPSPILTVLGVSSCFFPAVPVSKDIRYLLTCQIDPLTIGSLTPMIVTIPSHAPVPAAPPSRSSSPPPTSSGPNLTSTRDISTPAKRPPSSSGTMQSSSSNLRKVQVPPAESVVNPNTTSIKWSIRVYCPSVLQASIDRSREEHFNAVKLSWEKKEPGRAKRAKSTRDEYLQQISFPRNDATTSLSFHDGVVSPAFQRTSSSLSTASLSKEEKKEFDQTTIVQRRPFVDPGHPYLAPEFKEHAAKKNNSLWGPEQRASQEILQLQQQQQTNLHYQVIVGDSNVLILQIFILFLIDI